ncbi:uroporphyrinogen decarboxylase [Solenopsis invicta]|uniref:uroporphyrinogen decarboxylase n=1 Tax=Solenopsis invicta TaxID=13686 RepID=UPI000595CD57|nr:uroporphyrinogen decarboxylase [Solenopsis invicta]XP_039307849.1 uroporphyrinogen decarboxylase [Solenopsis invicta]XP_039307858.1 uroporphyrinogen decarboxylase [Solenopsis invicta]XP_039307860.1 uroporphyrinogen decarboxylase [Solenopsis invicta]
MIEHNFPPLKNDQILKAARGEPVDRVPVWVMRQAGRYLPEFQKVRAQHDFFSVCQTPALACQVTLQPIERFELDASIIFSDILVIPQAMGLKVEMVPGVGPVLPQPLADPSDLTRLVRPNVNEALKYVGDAITLTRHKLDGRVPLIGFTGAPWTLMGYMIQGGGSSTMAKARSWLYKYPEDTHKLLQMITDIIVDYLVMQVKAGAQLLQVFESNGDYLDDALFTNYSFKYLKQISDRVRKQLKEENIPEVPMIAFPKGATMNSLKILAKDQSYEVIGLDWTVDPIEARNQLGPNITLQGNMDPCAMYSPQDKIVDRAQKMVSDFGKTRYIANLGHGILPDTPITSMEAFIKGIHSA